MAILRWSWWRRWHQAWARYYHYKHRQGRTQLGPAPVTNEAAASDVPGAVDTPEAIDLAEGIWQHLEPLLPTGKRSGRPYRHDRRVIVEAIVYQRQTGCAWNDLPSHFPPYQTVHDQLRKWQKKGIWAKVWEGIQQSWLSQ